MNYATVYYVLHENGNRNTVQGMIRVHFLNANDYLKPVEAKRYSDVLRLLNVMKLQELLYSLSV